MLHFFYIFIHYLYMLLRHYLRPHSHNKKLSAKIEAAESYIPYTTRKKPQWVIDEVIRIKAMDPSISHKRISHLFNTTHEDMHIGKTFVGYTLKAHAYEIAVLRKELKSRPAHRVKFNRTWGIDLTFVNRQPILGVIEHHSRRVLALIPLRQKRSVNILLALLQLLKYYPAPKQIRTDNESCFTSRLMRFGLWFIGIKHQRIDKNSPWQNGRIERFFGTFKSSLSLLPDTKSQDLYYLSQSFTWWYNHIRPHMNLDYRTPADVYTQRIDEIRRSDA